MALIDQFDKEINELFRKHILKMRENGKPYFREHAVVGIESYYQSPQHSGFTHFSFIDLGSEETLKTEIVKCLGEPEGLQVAGPMASLAFRLREVQKEQPSELSPFVYVMY